MPEKSNYSCLELNENTFHINGCFFYFNKHNVCDIEHVLLFIKSRKTIRMYGIVLHDLDYDHQC